MGLLNREQILGRLGKGEIFLPGTWKDEQVRLAGYDLRVSSEVRGFNEETFKPGSSYGEVLELESGDSAYVLSQERFHMPWDLAANLGVRFRFARMGLSVMTGLLVDPGYGLGSVEKASRGMPLHFFVVNVGMGRIHINLGERGDAVLSVQFLETVPVEKQITTPEPGLVKPESSFGSFQGIRVIERRLDDEKEETELELEKLKGEIKGLREVVGSTKSAMDNIVVFGVFLLSVSLIGVVATVILQMLASDQVGSIVKHLNAVEGSGAIIAGVGGAMAVLASMVLLVIAITKTFSAAFHGSGGSQSVGSSADLGGSGRQ
jgi:deoxycytidine triphosphate deaminase